MAKEAARKAFWIVILTALIATVSAGATSHTRHGQGEASEETAAPALVYAEQSCPLAGPRGC